MLLGANMEPGLEAPMKTVASVAVQPTDPVLDHALSLVGFNHSCHPDHPVFKCLAHGGYETFNHLFLLNTENVRVLSYFNTSVSPPTWTTLSRGNQAALLTLIAYQHFYKATHDGTCLTQSDWLQMEVDTINDFILSGDRDFYIHDNKCPNFGSSGTCNTTVNHGSSKNYPSPGLCNIRFVHMSHHIATPMLTPAALVALKLPSMPTPSLLAADDLVDSAHLPAILTQNHHPDAQHCPLPASRDWSLDSGHSATTRTTTMTQIYVVAPTHDDKCGVPSLGLCPSSNQEFEIFPPVACTSSNIDWGPSILDGEYPLIDQEEILDGEEYPFIGLKASTTFCEFRNNHDHASGDYYCKENIVVNAHYVLITMVTKFHSAKLQIGEEPMDIGIVECVEPPGLRPPPEPPPRPLIDPTYIDNALVYFINITNVDLSSRIFVWSRVDPESIENIPNCDYNGSLFHVKVGWGENEQFIDLKFGPTWHILTTKQDDGGDTIGAPGKDKKLCVPESRCTSCPNGEMVELASQVRVLKKWKKKESMHCRSGLGSINFL